MKEKVFDSVAQDERSKRGVLEQTQKVADGIQEKISIIDEAKQPVVQKRKFLGIFSRSSQAPSAARARAIESSKQEIVDLRKSIGISDDQGLSNIINSLVE